MKKPKIGIAISLYDKWEELAILIDIIRKNWKGEYIISVCSNHKNPEPHVKGLDIDVFTKGEDIAFRPDMDWMRQSLNISCRILDCVKRSCTGAEKAGADFVMHLHTDAWPLKEQAVLDLAKELQEKNRAFAVRGMGFSRYRHDCPTGHVDDMFFLYDVKKMKDKRLFDFNTLAMLPHRLSTHGVLSLLLVGRVGIENIYHYENHTKQVFWDGKIHPGDLERARPSMLDKKRGMVHIDTPTFPPGYGKKIQAMYLKEYGVTKGPTIKAFLKEHLVPKTPLLRELQEIEERLDRKLRWCGFPVLSLGRFGRNYGKKQKYLSASFSRKLRYWANTTFRSVWERTIAQHFGVELIPQYSFWPDDLEEFLAACTIVEDYPETASVIWYAGVRPKPGIRKRVPPYYRTFYKQTYKGM